MVRNKNQICYLKNENEDIKSLNYKYDTKYFNTLS